MTIDKIHQILITDHPYAEGDIPSAMKDNVDSIRKFHPDAEYKLWQGAELRAFIAENFESRIVEAYDTLAAYTAKADLGRYCLLYKLGGLYSDLSNRFQQPIRALDNHELVCFRDVEPYDGAVWAITPTILYAKPNLEELKIAIDLLVDNVVNRHYGINPLCPTGPILFGRALATANRVDNYAIGKMVALTGNQSNRNHIFMSPDNRWIAVRIQKEGGSPHLLGLHGTNNYNELWRDRRYFGEPQKKGDAVCVICRFLEKKLRPILPIFKKSRGRRFKAFGMPKFDLPLYVHVFNDVPGSKSDRHTGGSLRQYHPEAVFKLWKDSEIVECMAANFDAETLSAYQDCLCAELRSVLARYCVLYVHGGILFNPTVRFIGRFDMPQGYLISCFRGGSVSSDAWSIDTAVVRSAPKTKELLDVIKLLVESIESREPLLAEPAPIQLSSNLLGRAMAMNYRQEKYWCGDAVCLPAMGQQQVERALVAPGGTMVAIAG